MALSDIRQRSGYLFLIVTLGHIILISAQVNSRAGVPVLETVTFGVFSEIQRAASAAVGTLKNAWTGYVALRHVRAENEALRRQLGELAVRLQEDRAMVDQNRRLQQLLGLRSRAALQTTGASVIAVAAAPDFRTLTLDKGTRDGLRSDMAVVAPAGVVGRIVIPSARAAKVQLLVDRNAAAGALIERSRAQGVVVGTGEDRLQMEYVSETADVRAGDLVVTSGIDGIYPKGFVIGRVEAIDHAPGSYKTIRIRPAVNFSALEEVLIVLTPSASRSQGEERE